MKQGAHCYVSGRVQGVCFRACTCSRARALGLTGWVRNLPDGRVELQAFGDAEPLEQLRSWLRRGPEAAEVRQLDWRPIDCQPYPDFSISVHPSP